MFKFVSLALLLSVCSAQQIVSLNGLNGINGATQYVLVPVGGAAVEQPTTILRQPTTILRQAVQPVARVLSAPRVIAAPRIYAAQPQVIEAPRIITQAPRQVVLQAPKQIIARAEESYGPAEPYTFGFQSTDEQGNTLSRSETSDGNGAVKGSYSYTDVDGLIRVVEYVADAAGYRANVRTNEPGTANANPADVQLQVEEVPSNVAQKVAQYSQYSAQKQRIA